MLLLGDNIGDVNMAKGLPEDCTVLNVGFLNDRFVAPRGSGAQRGCVVLVFSLSRVGKHFVLQHSFAV